MKEIIVKNHQTAAAVAQSQNGNTFSVKPIIDEIDKCSANFVEVEPGNYAYGYHYHEENEEVFYIISGEARVKTENGDLILKAGDAVCFPANRQGSHVVYNNSSKEKLIYLDVGTANRPDIVHFTGTGAGMVIAKEGIFNFKE